MISGEHMKGHTELPSAIWMRDLDGTGSMHPCAKGDPGAITYVPEDSVNTYPAVAELVEALEIIAGERQCLDNLMGNVDVAHAALTRFHEAQAGGGA